MIDMPQGYRFASVEAGFKYHNRDDLSLVVSDCPAHAAGVFTTNRFQAAPVVVSRNTLHAAYNDGKPKGNPEEARIRAILVNAGQANACTGKEGEKRCLATRTMAATHLGIEPEAILVASTGVIGDQLPMPLFEQGIIALAEQLGASTPLDMAKAIMTTDTFPKLMTTTLQLAAGEVRLMGMCKGAGMICPDMATMLGFILCDAEVHPHWWQEALRHAVDTSFNAITVDGDTSTNDCVLALANECSGVEAFTSSDQKILAQGLTDLCRELAFCIVQDAEGGTKVLRIRVSGAKSKAQAETVARVVGHSPLVKTALYGEDPNWGRIVAAVGRSGAAFEPDDVCVALGETTIFANGQPVEGDWDSLLAPVLRRDEITLSVSLGAGRGRYELLASDLTEGYIKINARYRT